MLNKCGLISDSLWCDIDCVGNAFLLCSFLYLLKDKIHSFIYSLGMSVFVSRLITELLSGGEEYWHEMISVIILTCTFYFVSKHLKNDDK